MIVVPTTVWQRMLDVFGRKRRDQEQVAYLDGYVGSEGLSIVTTVTFPAARAEALHFAVTAHAMSAAGKHLRAHRMRRIAQVHTHPSAWTGHSSYDDEHAYSQRPGAVSIVLPYYGRGQPRPTAAGVHLRTERGWTELEPAAAQALIHLVPSDVNLRGQR